ncbi:MAG: winged helix-turn-helix domain-containing protein [Alphaproteobacteria bacterium]
MARDRDGVLRFLDFTLDLPAAELSRNGEPVQLEPQVLDLIVYMATHPKRVVSRDELIEAIWQGRAVSDSAVSTRINAARRALGDDGRTQAVIKTVHGRGFRWEIEPVPVSDPPQSGAGVHLAHGDQGGDTVALPWPDKPSVAVHPFTVQGGARRHEFFADGVTEEVILGLSRLGSIFVIARNSSFSYKNRPQDTGSISRDLGVRYLVVGGIRAWQDNVRVSAQLVDASNGRQVWSEAIDGQLDNMLSAEQEIAHSIVSSVHTQLLLHEGLVSERKDARNQHVKDLLNRAWRATADWSREELAEAQQLADQALAREPDNPRAHIIAALAGYGRTYLGYTDLPADELDRATTAAQKAIRLAPNDEYAQWVLACCSWSRGEHDRAAAHARRAIEINPNFSWAHGTLGTALAWSGACSEAIEHTNIALRYNPRDATVYFRYLVLALSHFGLAEYEVAESYADRVIRMKPDWFLGHAFKVASLHLLGRHAEADAAVNECRAYLPTISRERIQRLPFKDKGVHERMTRALDQSGLVEARDACHDDNLGGR